MKGVKVQFEKAFVEAKESMGRKRRGRPPGPRTIDHRNELRYRAYQAKNHHIRERPEKMTYKDVGLARFPARQGHTRRVQTLVEGRAGKGEEYPHGCHLCPFRSKHLGNLRKHIRITHDDAVSHLCSACGRGLSTKVNARKHQTQRFTPLECRNSRIVIAPKYQIKANWICSACEVSFELEDEYEQHRSESTSSACKTGRSCHIPSLKERFAVSSKLKEQLKEYPTCPICLTPFLNTVTLYRHQRTHHQGERTICTGCKQLYARDYYVQRHQTETDECNGAPWFYVPPPGPTSQILCLCCGKICDTGKIFNSHKKVSNACSNAEGYLIAKP
ncbi:hypothetical protein BT69DRAFT_1317730 [Atractiella rhizophila]|nr:hypothetical protein BT69DRAFT_1317730 [Atractiella rhizophila]